jgi:hypothetical protein
LTIDSGGNSGRLAELEEAIDKNLSSAFEAFKLTGAALTEIQRSKLYRVGHRTFADYCETRWSFTERRARQLMDAAEIGTRVPISSERQARELARLPDQGAQTRAWEEARQTAEQDGRPVATADVRAAVELRRPKQQIEKSPPPASSPAAVPAERPQEPRDEGLLSLERCCQRLLGIAEAEVPNVEAAVLDLNPEDAKQCHATFSQISDVFARVAESTFKAVQGDERERSEADRLGIELR